MRMKLDLLFWKWGNGCCKATIDDSTGKIIILSWNHPTLPKPTAAKIKKASDEYEQHLIDQPIQDEKDYKKLKTNLKTKLDMDEAQFKIFEKFFKSDKDGG